MNDEKESVGGKGLKVTDKRMFTAAGELRDEYRHLDEEVVVESAPGSSPEKPADEPAREPVPTAPASATEEPSEASPRLEIPGTPPGMGAPSFLDLVTLLAEPVALYLGDIELPDGKSAENLEMARLHIDLLDVLRRKTAGNLDAAESGLLEDLLYRYRLRYVQKRD
jgi:hypothetical protein